MLWIFGSPLYLARRLTRAIHRLLILALALVNCARLPGDLSWRITAALVEPAIAKLCA
jgi:hypothetical protein